MRPLFRRRRQVELVVQYRLQHDVSEWDKQPVRHTARADGRSENLLRVPRGTDRRRIGHNSHLRRDGDDDQFPKQIGHEIHLQRVLRRTLRTEAVVFVLRGPRDTQHRVESERKWPNLTGRNPEGGLSNIKGLKLGVSRFGFRGNWMFRMVMLKLRILYWTVRFGQS